MVEAVGLDLVDLLGSRLDAGLPPVVRSAIQGTFLEILDPPIGTPDAPQLAILGLALVYICILGTVLNPGEM